MTHVEVAGTRPSDRRHWPRVRLAVPVEVSPGAGGRGEAAPQFMAQSSDLSPGGLYLTTRDSGAFAPGEMLTVSIAIPWEFRQRFPFSRLMGPCRVVRVDEVTTESGATRGVALAFCGTDAVTFLGTVLIPR